MSSAIGEAFVRIRPDTRGFAAETKKGVGSALKTGLAFAGIGGGIAIVTKTLRDANREFRAADTIQRQASAALEANGLSWDRYGTKIEDAANKQAKLQSFDDEEVVQGFTRIYRNVKDVDEALRLAGIAGDLATARMTNGQRDLAGASLIVAKVAGGNVGILRRYGIELKKGATAAEALAALQEKVAGSGAAFAAGAEGGAARLNKVWGDTLEIIGQGVSPAIEGYQRDLADWLETANRSGETQRIVNTYLGGGIEVLKGVASGFQTARRVVSPFVDALGGVERTAKLVVLALAVGKVAKFALAVRGAAASFGFIAASSRVTTAKVVADSVVAGRALDVAYRPRTVFVGFGGPGGKLGGGLLAGGLGLGLAAVAVDGALITGAPKGSSERNATTAGAGLGAVAGAPIGPAASAALSVLGAYLGKQFGKALDDVNPKMIEKKGLEALAKSGLTGKQRQLWREGFLRAVYMGTTGEAAVDYANNYLRKKLAEMAPPTTTKPTVKTAKGDKRPTGAQVEARIGAFGESKLNAQIARNVGRERQVLVAEKAYLEQQVKNTRLSVAQRRAVKAELNSVIGEIDRIDEQAARDAAAASAAAKTRSDKAFATMVKTRIGGLERKRREAVNRKDLDEQAKILREEESFLRGLIRKTTAGSVRREQLLALLQTARDRAAALKAKVKKPGGTVDTVFNALERQRREAAAKGDEKAQTAILAKEEKHLRDMIAKAAKGSLTREKLQNQLVTVHERQAKLKKSTASTTGETVQDVFRQALDAWRTDGSNIGGTGAMLSRQDVRGFVGGRIVSHMTAGMSDEQIRTRLMEAGVTEARRQTEILNRIHAELTRTRATPAPPKAKTTPKGVTPSIVSADSADFHGYGRVG